MTEAAAPEDDAPTAGRDDWPLVETVANSIAGAFAKAEARVCEDARRRYGPKAESAIKAARQLARRRLAASCDSERLRADAASAEEAARRWRRLADDIDARRTPAGGSDAA